MGAPRDVVARAIHSQIVAEGDPHVWLDISHLPRNKVLRSFPAFAAHCLSRGSTSRPRPSRSPRRNTTSAGG